MSDELRNAYNLLGLNPQASKAEIKFAFRDLAKRLHPDKNPSSEAEATFQQVNEAYQLVMRSFQIASEKTGESVDYSYESGLSPTDFFGSDTIDTSQFGSAKPVTDLEQQDNITVTVDWEKDLFNFE
jgi:curved DNA-binding protein CbpA